MNTATAVIDVLRHFLPAFLMGKPFLTVARRRAAWAILRCRTAVMGGHIHACNDCGKWEFAYHSCNHRSCPQCGRSATGKWVERELAKRVAAPYFMVTFTLPSELRGLFLGAESDAKTAYNLFFAAASRALREKLADPKWLGVKKCGFTAVLHTWNQRLHFHPHIHCIVPGAGLDTAGNYLRVKNANFLVPVGVLNRAFRAHMRQGFEAIGWEVDPAVWRRDWGVDIRPFGDGKNAIKYLGRYVSRTAIGDSRIADLDQSAGAVTFTWKDRADHDRTKRETIPGVDFVKRYLRHVLPRKMRSIRYFGFCHPAAKATRERVAFHSGMPLVLEPGPQPEEAAAKDPRLCPHCQGRMKVLRRVAPSWRPLLPRRPPPEPAAASP